jgi:hypothetical protein
VPVVALTPGFRAGDTTVQVTGIDPNAQLVEVYANGTTLIGTAAGSPPTTPATMSITVPPLVLGDALMARQTLNGVVGCMPAAGVPVAGAVSTLAADGFGDGDRNNDGTPEGPVDDPADVGLAWYKCLWTSDPILGVAHDAGGLGDDNAFFTDSTATRTYEVASLPSEVILDEPGEYIRLTFEWRLTGAIPSNRDAVRFGIFNDQGTKVTADQADLLTIEYDAGYFGTLTTGAPSTSNERLARNDPSGNQAALWGLSAPDEQLLNVSPALHIINDNSSHTLSLTIMRSSAGTALVDLAVDGATAMSAEDNSDSGGPLLSFNEIGIGQVASVNLDYAIDNVQVVIAQACTAPGVVSISPIDGRSGQALTGVAIAGSTFVAGQTSVRLTRTGQADIVATSVTVADAGHLTCDLNLAGAAEGLWDVVVTTSCSFATLANGFEVKPPCNDPPQDTDGDGDVDLGDFGTFQTCFNGPNREYSGGSPVADKCRCMDADPDDSDVDLTDFGKFQACFNGPNRPPQPAC